MKIVNPATSQLVREYDEHSEAEVQAKLASAQQAFENWRVTSFEQRARAMLGAAQQLRERRQEFARLITVEMGKPVKQAESEIEKCAWVCEYYAEKAEGFLAAEYVEIDDAESYVRFDPLGPVLAIMPWNFPFWQVFRFAAPALMAGNVGLLKHASNVAGSALAIEDVFRQAGFPTGAMTTLLIAKGNVGELIQNPVVRAVTLTGSERAGMAVASEAGKQIKKSVLELGGSDPFVVLADADLPRTVDQAVQARTVNSGQSCIAAKRFIVETGIIEPFIEQFVQQMQRLRVGDPTDPSNDIGPLAREDLRKSLHEQVTRSIDMGANCLCGGEPLPGQGYYYPPTVLTDVGPGMPAFDEETFGPVAAVICANNSDEAIELANRSEFGLGASIWTSDTKRAEMLAVRVESGCVFINEMVKSDPRVPFGGIKRSGFGRELAEFGIREFTNTKTVWIRQD